MSTSHSLKKSPIYSIYLLIHFRITEGLWALLLLYCSAYLTSVSCCIINNTTWSYYIIQQCIMYDVIDCIYTTVLLIQICSHAHFGLKQEKISMNTFLKNDSRHRNMYFFVFAFSHSVSWLVHRPGNVPPYQMVLNSHLTKALWAAYRKCTHMFMLTQCCAAASIRLIILCIPDVCGAKSADGF